MPIFWIEQYFPFVRTVRSQPLRTYVHSCSNCFNWEVHPSCTTNQGHWRRGYRRCMVHAERRSRFRYQGHQIQLHGYDSRGETSWPLGRFARCSHWRSLHCKGIYRRASWPCLLLTFLLYFPMSLKEMQKLSSKLNKYVPEADEQKTCHGCDKKGSSLQKCARCKLFWYCDAVSIARLWNLANKSNTNSPVSKLDGQKRDTKRIAKG